jgi:predicted O-linked N-acetylglucosamine transferase (SPINDLY family)
MRLTIISSDKFISIDGQGLLDIEQDLSWIPSNVRAVQWYDTWGEVEYKDETPNLRIEELGIFDQAVEDLNNEIVRIEQKQIADAEAAEAARDYWEELRVLRNQRLVESDWTQVADAPLTEEQKVAWQSYRQALRNLPENISDPKPLVLDSNHSDWTVKPY